MKNVAKYQNMSQNTGTPCSHATVHDSVHGAIMLCRGYSLLRCVDFGQSKAAYASTMFHSDGLGLYHVNPGCIIHLSSEK